MGGDSVPQYDGYVFDLDGTIYLGDRLIPGVDGAIARIRGRGGRVVFLSNKPLEPSARYAEKLSKLGVPVETSGVINSTQALIAYLRAHHEGERLYVIGEPALIDEMTAEGFVLTDDPAEIDIVVAAFDRTLDYQKLNTAYQALVRGARFYATNADKACPIDGGAIPDCAGVIAFLEATTDREVELVAGKPSRHILDAALARLQVPADRCLVVGDRLSTDMVMALSAGIDAALVLSGVTSREMVAGSGVAPTHIISSVAVLS